MRTHDELPERAVAGQRPSVVDSGQPAVPLREGRPLVWTPATVAALQRTAGNTAVQRALAQEEHAHGPGCGHHQDVPLQRSTVPDVLASPGRPLDDEVRTDMESRFGADFSDVRMHTDTAAQRSAAEIGAEAYTSGSHVVIGAGGADRHTLAHELTHVIQQRLGPVAGTDDGSGLRISDPSDRFEREAEAHAHRVLAGPSPEVRAEETSRSAASGAVQRMTHFEPGQQVTANPGFSVILTAQLDGNDLGTFTSQTAPHSPGDHAEDQLVDEIQSIISGLMPSATGRAALGAGTAHTLSISLTASPCSSARGTAAKVDGGEGCAERLIDLAQNGLDGHTFAITLRAHHLYQPQGIQNARQLSQQAVGDMQAAGITVTIG